MFREESVRHRRDVDGAVHDLGEIRAEFARQRHSARHNLEMREERVPTGNARARRSRNRNRPRARSGVRIRRRRRAGRRTRRVDPAERRRSVKRGRHQLPERADAREPTVSRLRRWFGLGLGRLRRGRRRGSRRGVASRGRTRRRSRVPRRRRRREPRRRRRRRRRRRERRRRCRRRGRRLG